MYSLSENYKNEKYIIASVLSFQHISNLHLRYQTIGFGYT